MSGEIVLGYDGTEGSEAALEEAVRLSDQLGLALVAVFGFQPPVVEREIADHREALLEYGKKQVTHAVERARECGVEAQGVVVDKRPSEALVQVAEEHHGRCIVVGTSGIGPIKSALLGSTPHKLLQVADRPVVVVPG
jgi:nucleotide-binding universal stress UspA family protein